MAILKLTIADNAPVLHGASPRVIHHGYTVVTSREVSAAGDIFRAALIAYSGPSGSTEGTLLRKGGSHGRLVEAMHSLLAEMEKEMAYYLQSSAPGEKIGYRHTQADGDQTPKACHSPQHLTEHQEASAKRRTVTVPRKALSHSRSTPEIIPDASRDRSTSHHATTEYLRSQGFAEPVPPVPPVPRLAYKAYRMPAEPPQRGYRPYRQPPQARHG